MKKIAELSLSVGSNNHLLGINEKYDLLFIQKGKELILFSLKVLEVLEKCSYNRRQRGCLIINKLHTAGSGEKIIIHINIKRWQRAIRFKRREKSWQRESQDTQN